MEPVTTRAQHVVVAGAGVIGLACALELALAGLQVTVVERGRPMEEASWAAAGMLAVDDPENPLELLEFSRFSRGLYGEFLARVEALSGLRVPLRTHTTRQLSRGALELVHALELDAASRLEEASLDPRDLCIALPLAAQAAGVKICRGTATMIVAEGQNRVRVGLQHDETLEADACLLACGAWTAEVAVAGAQPLAVVPRKGQMIEVTLEEPRLREVIRTPELYLLPRGDGRVAIGATVEDAGFDRSVDVQSGDRLWAEAGRVWPPILQGAITARWTGLRPAVLDADGHTALPLIGEIASGVFVATGHFRNGILLAPGTARLLRELLCGGHASPVTETFRDTFSPKRFSQIRTTLHESLSSDCRPEGDGTTF